MYNFIHYYIYNQQLQKGKSEGFARANGSMVAAMTISMHIALLLSVIKMILIKYCDIVLQPKYLWLAHPGLMTIFLIFYFRFSSKKNTELIMDKLATEKDPTRGSNTIKIVALIFVPIIIVFILAPK